ncbi:dTDP-4-dehydrorhamnose 3,5-epimerase [Sphingobacterium nematocida]|uniref:dTDP-4-dehydrorhamnose 3,5-epimerase n=1 Tax=Sphingobacterium nematocida TaxID=1513896 RepID=A0A1T5EYC7_9SPHI|nr:WxcM-like domain-containing protein [Sphingobacterium nematocida]SKB88926.1 dTDP-4-dehydrorhamnose 3,5-epimerase [Sphingobacterium nematocida]
MITVTKGGMASDHRGSIRFVNEFDMTQVKRFYIIENKDAELIRGWRAHRIEQRWFYVLSGSFILDLVKIEDWENVSAQLPIERRVLCVEDKQVVHVPAGYATAFQAIEEGAELLVFADYGIEHAANDDYTWPAGYFINRDEV